VGKETAEKSRNDGTDVEKAGDQLLRPRMDSPAAFQLGVFVAEDFQKTDHCLKPSNSGNVCTL
jgi:hypothetical protein